jgi:hypothetical protein
MQLATLTPGLSFSMVRAVVTVLTCVSGCHGVGVTITVTSDTGGFTVGSPAVVTCSSDSGVADRIEWRSGTGQMLVTSNSVQQLDLTFAPVSDSIHGSNFTCFVTRDEGRANQTLSNQTLPISVRGGCVQ